MLTIGWGSVGLRYETLRRNKKMFTLDQIKNALFPLINKDANTGVDKEANDFLLDCFNEAKKLIKQHEETKPKP